MKKTTKKITTTIMTAIMATSMLASCASDSDKKTHRKDKNPDKTNMEELQPLEREVPDIDPIVNSGSVYNYNNFSVELLKNTYVGNNIMVSPLSVMNALGMTMNGASGETLTQMEEVFGLSLNEVNELMYIYNENYMGEQLTQANAVYLNSLNGYEYQEQFRQNIINYYNSDINVGEFGPNLVAEINEFVSEHTNNRINDLISVLNPDDELVLVNALSFDATWRSPFESNEIFDRTFTLDNGEEITVSMMYGEEYGNYISGDNEEGFIKYYDGDYAFIALLPEEGMTMDEYLNTLSGDEVNEFIYSRGNGDVDIGLPQFESEYGDSLVDALSNMGMPVAFDRRYADFTNMLMNGDEQAELYISDVIHKTYIRVDSEGTEAAAATAVIMTDAASACEPDTHLVILNRPFVYMIVNTTTDMPVFMGVYNGVEM